MSSKSLDSRLALGRPTFPEVVSASARSRDDLDVSASLRD